MASTIFDEEITALTKERYSEAVRLMGFQLSQIKYIKADAKTILEKASETQSLLENAIKYADSARKRPRNSPGALAGSNTAIIYLRQAVKEIHTMNKAILNAKFRAQGGL